MLAYAAFTIRSLPTTEPLPLRLRRLIAIGVRGRANIARSSRSAANAEPRSPARPASTTAVGDAILDLHEHWDGGGEPRGLAWRGDPPAGPDPRRVPGPRRLPQRRRPGASASTVLAERRGTWYDPDVVDALLDAAAHGLLDDLAAPDLVGRTMSLEPGGTIRTSDDEAIDRIASAFADIVDAKSPFTGSHSQRVADIAEVRGDPPWPSAAAVVDVRRPACSTISASSVSRTSSSTSRSAGAVRDGGHPPPSGADAADPRAGPDLRRASPSSPPVITSGSTAAATSAGSPSRSSRSAPGSSRSPTSSRR